MKSTMDFSKLIECDVIVKEIISRHNKGLGTNIFIIGLSGTGKSSTSMRVGELTQEQHKIEVKMFIVDSLLKLIEAIRNSNLGDIIIVEEVSVLFPSRRSMARENVSMNKIFDTIRKKQLVIISNAPILGSIDSHMKALGHIIIETLKIYKTQKVVVSKALRMQTNPRSGKTYFHRFRREGREVHRVFTRMPNSETWKEYESNKDQFMDELYNTLKYEQEAKNDKINKQMGKASDRELKEQPTSNELVAHRKVRLEGKPYRKVAKEMGFKNQKSIYDLLKSLDSKTRIFQKPKMKINETTRPNKLT